MLRVLVVLVIAFAALWFMLRDGTAGKSLVREDAERIEMAKAAVSAQEDLAAQVANQADAVRDQALGRDGSGDDTASEAGE